MADAIYVPKSDILDLITEENEAGGFTDYSNYSNLWDEVDDMPAADVQPVKHGRWITWDDSGFTKCSCCNSEYYIVDLQTVGDSEGFVNFCPNCGARMEREKNE